jgi:translation initiation factor IF-1
MSAACRGATAAMALGLTLALGACGGPDAPAGAPSEPAAAPVATAPPVTPASSPTDIMVSPSALPQGIVNSSSFGVGDLVSCTVTRVQPLLVLLDGHGRGGVIRGSAYEKVKVGDRVIVKVTKTDGRFEATLVHVSTSS